MSPLAEGLRFIFRLVLLLILVGSAYVGWQLITTVHP